MGNGRKVDNTASGIDKGFVFSYWKLSYRRKFIRTLWIMVLIPTILLVPNSWSSQPSKYLVVSMLMLIGLVQAIYNYKKWKKS